MSSCLARVARRNLQCLEAQRRSCAADDARVGDSLDALERSTRASCAGEGTIEAAGFGPDLTLDGLVARLREACHGDVASLASRTFGGPEATVYRVAGSRRRCLAAAFRKTSRYVRAAFRAHSRCLRRARAGRSCDAGRLDVEMARLREKAAAGLAGSCGDLAELILVDGEEYLERAAAQVRCLVPTAHGAGDPLALDCGPRTAIPVPPPATPTQIVLDESVWGTRCGDGSPYAFWIRMAPDGAPPENVVVHMQGGGICLLNSDCRRVSSGLMRALDNNLATGGYLSNTNASNPFRDWTKVYLPYCTQDVHMGGGVTSTFPDRTVHRYGAVNVRAALRYVRDVLWARLSDTPEGFRPDRLRVLFGGTSAGGFGASFNYHYLLDDLRWSRATAAPGAALGVDNGLVFGMRGLGIFFDIWGGRPHLPPYCAGRECSVVPTIQRLHSNRLGAVPEQLILNVSNQVDDTQVATTYFTSQGNWIDAHRAAYCENQGRPGLRYFLPAVPRHIHTILGTSSQFPGLQSEGVTLGTWLGEAMSDPTMVEDRVEEGDLVSRYGADPFACDVGERP